MRNLNRILLLTLIVLFTTMATLRYMQPMDVPQLPPVAEVKKEPFSFVKTEPIRLTAEERLLLARNIYFEAGVEGLKGKIAVAQVTYNRWKSGKWGKSLKSVVYAKGQFSWTLYKAKRNKIPKGEIWNECLQAASEFQNGLRIEGMEDTMHYHAEYVRPTWANLEAKVVQIGSHIFYTL